MQIRNAVRYSFVTFVALSLALSVHSSVAATLHSGGQNPGGVRPAETSQTVASLEAPNLNISVNYRGKAISKAQVSITSVRGAVVASGVTTKSGKFSASLGSGTYALAASSNGHVATRTITIGATSQSISLTLH